jgi:excinuclease ABC subunit A
MEDKIVIRGAKEHNLKNIDLEIPRNKLIVFTGLSGSGKSSLAFDTIYAEGQRRYIESLSSYARQFLGQMDRPDVESIEGLSPAISIDQKGVSRNPRSTVGTVTEIYDYFRLLYARIGVPYCPNDGTKIEKLTVDEIVDVIIKQVQTAEEKQPESKWVKIFAPVVAGRKGEYLQLLYDLYGEGFSQARIDGTMHHLREKVELARYKQHSIDVLIDEFAIKTAGDQDDDIITRMTEAVELSLSLAKKYDNRFIIASINENDRIFSSEYSCPVCGFSFSEINPRLFSFNSPQGACEHCHGLGSIAEFDPQLVIPDDTLSISQGAVMPANYVSGKNNYYSSLINSICEHYNIRQDIRVKDLPPDDVNTILYGRGRDKIRIKFFSSGRASHFSIWFEGLINNLKNRYEATESDNVREELNQYMSSRPCEVCQGNRLRPEALAIKVGHEKGMNISELTRLSVSDAHKFFNDLSLEEREHLIAERILNEISSRLLFLVNVGLNYLSLNRTAGTLSGGEAQRIRLASQIGSGLTGVLYVLDEPTIGLHQRDNKRLLDTLTHLRELGNTVVVVEHDEDTIWTADHIVDIGPGAGRNGGRVMAQGTLEDIMKAPESVTAAFLRGDRYIPLPEKRRQPGEEMITIVGASENNLKQVNVSFPLGMFVAVTGVSGSGKSTLVNDILHKAVNQKLNRSIDRPGKHKEIQGLKFVDKIIAIDQSPIGRTPRSNPATYTGIFTPIREIFAATPEARVRGYQPGRFSFNVSGGRCEACQGNGTITIEMHFLPDIEVACEVCKGKRYNRETLEVTYKGKSIYEILQLTIEEALEFFTDIPQIKDKMQTLTDVGLGYIQLGQSATTLSGGEAQRVKLSSELSKRGTGKTLYILDEPTTGLHFADIEKLLLVLNRLVEKGNSVVVIEHNLDVIKTADYLIDLGPEGGDKGGKIIAAGTPEEIANTPASHTGKFLAEVLEDYKKKHQQVDKKTTRPKNADLYSIKQTV